MGNRKFALEVVFNELSNLNLKKSLGRQRKERQGEENKGEFLNDFGCVFTKLWIPSLSVDWDKTA